MSFWDRLFRPKSEDESISELRKPERIPRAESAARFENPPNEATDLFKLLTMADEWGAKNRWPLHDQYPQYERIRELGAKLYATGGIQAMQRAYYFVEERNVALASSLSEFWHGVGSWMA